jgi:hypothetical protein
MMKLRIFLLTSILMLGMSSCSNDDDSTPPADPSLLSTQIEEQQISQDRVTAYGYSGIESSSVLMLYYQEPNATNVTFFKTDNAKVNRNDYSNYRVYDPGETRAVLGAFRQTQEEQVANEYFAIVKYTINNQIKLSNPIRVNHINKPTSWTEVDVAVDQSNSGLPKFTWERNVAGDSSIFLFGLFDQSGDGPLVSILTTDTEFLYFDTSNAVFEYTLGTLEPLNFGELHQINFLDING